ncbi:hypothetical protein U9M48_005695 [Paspalum notatum var. saurae]|uniref:Uncharacterized protein n=1 Tax=Paspalum notatum var. saurae TaxID=547442 RepID=A0AAQ3PRG6_PASNO
MAAGRAATALVRSLGMRTTKMAAPPPPPPPHRLAAARGLSGSAAGSSTQPPPPNMKAGHKGDPNRSRRSFGDMFVDALFTTFNTSVAIWFIGGAFVRPKLNALENRIAALERSKTMKDLDAMEAVHRELERITNEHGGPKAITSES